MKLAPCEHSEPYMGIKAIFLDWQNEMEEEWKLENRGPHGIEIMHKICVQSAFVYNTAHSFTFYMDRMWTCSYCKKKAPDHVILQWKIATGK